MIELLSNTGYIMYNKAIARSLGVNEAIMIGELCQVALKNSEDEFCITQNKIEADTGLSPYQQRKAIVSLIEQRIATKERRGSPSQNFYRINRNGLYRAIEKFEQMEAQRSGL